MSTERSWLIRKAMAAVFDSEQASVVGPETGPVRVVEEARLREVEAERDLMERANETSMGIADSLAGDVERLEAQLQEMRWALEGIADWTTPGGDVGSLISHNEEASRIVAWIHERARGVLRKGDTGAG